MCACSRHLQPGAFRCGNQLAARAMHLDAQIADAVANPRARFHDGLVQLGLDLFRDVRRSLGNQLADVRTQLARRRINNLKFFFDADGEAVSHVCWPSGVRELVGDFAVGIIPRHG